MSRSQTINWQNRWGELGAFMQNAENRNIWVCSCFNVPVVSGMLILAEPKLPSILHVWALSLRIIIHLKELCRTILIARRIDALAVQPDLKWAAHFYKITYWRFLTDYEAVTTESLPVVLAEWLQRKPNPWNIFISIKLSAALRMSGTRRRYS